MRIERIGDATLYLADCMSVLPTLGNVDDCVTDPPYGMGFLSNHRREPHSAIENDDNTEALLFACGIQAAHSKYVFCRWDNLASVPKPKSLVTWVKNNWSMGDLNHEHARQTETILFYPGPDHFFAQGRPQDVIYAARTGNDNHPTEKPVGLMTAIVQWTSGVVIDPYLGSGTTGVACAKLGRKFIGIEINEDYFNIACERIAEAYRQPRLFAEPAAKPVQEAMDV